MFIVKIEFNHSIDIQAILVLVKQKFYKRKIKCASYFQRIVKSSEKENMIYIK